MEDFNFSLLEFIHNNDGIYSPNDLVIKFRENGDTHTFKNEAFNKAYQDLFYTKRIETKLIKNKSHCFITDRGLELYKNEKSKRDREHKLKDNEYRATKHWWIPIAISLLALVSSIVVPIYLHNTDVSDKSQGTEQLNVLEQKLQETNSNLLHTMDSLYKKAIQADTIGSK
jgi:hypothetical protein